MDVTGIIFASVDCDADAVEAWNRWYDLEHLPPNIALPGIMTGKRYVAPPSLHDVREPADPLEGFANGRGVHVTIYTLGGDPAQVLADMTTYRDKLEAAGRMFAPEKKIVRAGDAMTWSWGVADPALKADPDDIPHIQHTSIRAVLRRGGDDDARGRVAPAAVAVEGVHAVLGHRSITDAGLDLDLYLLEGDPVAVHARRPHCRAVRQRHRGRARRPLPVDRAFRLRLRRRDPGQRTAPDRRVKVVKR